MSIARFSRADMERIARDFVRGERALRADTVPKPESPAGLSGLSVDAEILISALVSRGQDFYMSKNQKFSGGDYNIGLALSLEAAFKHAGSNGFVPSMPLIIAGKSKADKGNYLWRSGHDCLSEELVGVDEHDNPLVVVVHGVGVLTGSPERIMKAYSVELVDGWGKISNAEFAGVLNGELPNGRRLSGVYSVEDVIDGKVTNPLSSKYAVWLPLATVQSVASGYLEKPAFMDSHLVIARAGTLDYLDGYFDKAKGSHPEKDKVGNHYSLVGLTKETLKAQPRGRVLFVSNSYDGLIGYDYLSNNGRFVGVAPEAP